MVVLQLNESFLRARQGRARFFVAPPHVLRRPLRRVGKLDEVQLREQVRSHVKHGNEGAEKSPGMRVGAVKPKAICLVISSGEAFEVELRPLLH